jgi:hypothetical protein
MQFITMVMVEDTWASIAWDMKRRQLTIYAAANSSGDWDAYDKIANLLKAAFRRCIETFFDGWYVDWVQWATVYTTASCLEEKKPQG